MNVREEWRKGAKTKEGIEVAHGLPNLNSAVSDVSSERSQNSSARDFKLDLLSFCRQFFNPVAELSNLRCRNLFILL